LRHDIQHNDTQHNMTLSTMAKLRYSAKFKDCTEQHVFTVILSVIVLSIVMLAVLASKQHPSLKPLSITSTSV
jgi:hypothetical protein